MGLLTIFTILICISAAFSYLNERFIKFPETIGIVIISIAVSVIILIVGETSSAVTAYITSLATQINFSAALLNVLLGFLLFAAAIHFDYQKLKEQRWPVFLLATVGVMISTAVYGALFYFVARLTGFLIPFVDCLLFGALISPTDPISVNVIIQKSIVPAHLKTIILGESLFNDAVGLMLFVVLLNLSQAGTSVSVEYVLKLFATEIIGGLALGVLAGFIGYRLMKAIETYQTVLLISISIVLAISVIANYANLSIPLSAVGAGLIIGNKSRNKDKKMHNFLSGIWQLIDQVLNTILFVLIGLQLVEMPFLDNYWFTGFLSILTILIARLVSVTLPAIILLRKFNYRNLAILTWAGLRGGISLAMALSLPNSQYRDVILSCCYFIVIFSTIVQGLTLNSLVNKLFSNRKRKKAA